MPGNQMWLFLGLMLLLFLVPNILTGRSTKKKQSERQNMLDSLKSGDEVITIGGFYGTIEYVGNDYFLIKFARGDTAAKIKKEAISTAANLETSSAPSASTSSGSDYDDDIYAPIDDDNKK